MTPATRTGIGVLGVALLGAGALGWVLGAAPAPGALVLGGLILLSLLIEGRYRRPAADAPSSTAGWQPTDEIFRDDESGRWLRVWFNPQTGERRYVEAPPRD